ncbi:Flp pilus assembly protein CpaB [Terasakiella sp. A23]|uniref:Flp pilus assembly protein CpaB n=1 Tax=Terasakiella sp. FCG-A23 TaxID=3080561 RepID=UPI002954BEF3|nr:Flp pilus assembly protein CpaB [Terasakiella sp. A23]MDV7340377.1 Flp pilus assembly protein CpaB [Terasakiella sp. A23]
MSVRIIILLLLALISAGGTAMLAQNWLASERAQIMASVPKIQMKTEDHVEILVAKADLIPGSFVLKEKLTWQEWPEDAVGDRMLKKGDVDIEDFVGSVIRSRIPAGQPLLPSAMVRSGEQGFMAAVLTPGMRAVTVPLSATSGVGGFVFPGDKVDLLLSITLKPEGEESILKRKFYFTETLLKNVRVIGKDQSAVQSEGEAKVAKSATLEVTPKQAEKVALATQIGKLSLSLRPIADETTILAEDIPMMNAPVDQLKHKIGGFDQYNNHPSIPRLELDDDMSLTTDVDVNFFWQKMAKYAPSVTGEKSSASSKVQVHRGSKSTTQEFK